MNDVAFRRIHGRIVPIKAKNKQLKNKKELSVTANLALAGTAAVGSGVMASRILQDSARMENSYESMRKMGPLFASAANEAIKHHGPLFKKAMSVRTAGAAMAAGFVGAGINKALKDRGHEKNKPLRAAATAAGTYAAFRSLRFAHYMDLQSGFRLRNLEKGKSAAWDIVKRSWKSAGVRALFKP